MGSSAGWGPGVGVTLCPGARPVSTSSDAALGANPACPLPVSQGLGFVALGNELPAPCLEPGSSLSLTVTQSTWGALKTRPQGPIHTFRHPGPRMGPCQQPPGSPSETPGCAPAA